MSVVGHSGSAEKIAGTRNRRRCKSEGLVQVRRALRTESRGVCQRNSRQSGRISTIASSGAEATGSSSGLCPSSSSMISADATAGRLTSSNGASGSSSSTGEGMGSFVPNREGGRTSGRGNAGNGLDSRMGGGGCKGSCGAGQGKGTASQCSTLGVCSPLVWG